MYPKSFEYLRAKSVDQALQYLKDNEGSRVIAGGQSLLPMLKSRLYQPTVLVDINFIPELREVKLGSNGDLRIGAMVTHYDVIENSTIRENAPILSSTAENIADVQIRNRGTIGGSICEADPSADYLPTLMALDARVVLKTTESSREVKVEDFIQGPFETLAEDGEMLVEVIVPPSKANYRVEKYARRKADFAIASVAAIVSLSKDGKVTDARIATGAQQDKPHRLREIESALKGKASESVNLEAIIGPATEELEPLDDLHGGPEYRKHVLRGMLSRMLGDLLSGKEA